MSHLATIKNWPKLQRFVLQVNVWSFFFSFLIIVGVWVSLLAMIKNWPKLQRFVLQVNVWSFFFLLFFTSCHDQELAQIVKICVACECLEFFFYSLF